MNSPEFYKKRALQYANYILDNQTTAVQAGKHFGVSGSHISKEIKKWLPIVDVNLHTAVKEMLEQNQGKGFSFANKIKRTVIECECTNCKHNTAEYVNDKGYCKRVKIKLKYKDDLKTEDGDYTDVCDCENYEWENKGAEFRKGKE